MGALPRPKVPDGPVRALFDELHELHHRAGWPSLRDMAREVGCSHTTVSVAFSGPAVPKWGLVELIVEALGGDTGRFHALWLAASGARPAGPPTPDRPHEPVPRQLPADVAGFTGRDAQLTDLDRLFALASTSTTAVVITAISGTAGVGKTALAVHWAHRVASAFPDGQLYINLRGYDPERPVPAAEALEVLLRALGVDGAAVPQAPAERAARYRTLLAGRKMLVLLDNAHSVDQIRDLLPGTPSCLVLVTSRETLPALVARHGAVRINLDLLPTVEAVALLRTLIGARVDAEPEAAVALARRCARLPLALRIGAELVAARPATTLAGLVDELGDESRRLDLLAAGEDDYTAIRTVFSWSCRHLAADSAAAFELLGLHPGRDIDVATIAALVGTDVSGAYRRLGVLSRAHLVAETGPGRFGMHDLLRAYAAERAAARADRQPALTRLFDHYLDTARGAVGLVFPHDRESTVDSGARDVDGAKVWLTAERANLLAVAERAAAESPTHTVGFSRCLAYYLDARAHYHDGLALHRLALAAARALGDRAGEGGALHRLGSAYLKTGLYPKAIEHHERALDIQRELGDRAGEAAALHGLGTLYWRMGRHTEGQEHLEACLAIRRELGDRLGEGAALYGLGTVYRQLGRYREALDHQQRGLDIYRELGDRIGQSRVLNNLGTTFERMGRYTDALEHYRQALEVSTELGNRLGEGVALTNLGTTTARLGRYDEALDHHRRALPIYREVGHRTGEADGLHGLGDLYRRMGRYDEALEHLRQAVAIAREIGEADVEIGTLVDLGETLRATGRTEEAEAAYRSARSLAQRAGDRYEQARALAGSAYLAYTAGDLVEARQLWGAALTLYTELGVPEADEVQGHLAAAG